MSWKRKNGEAFLAAIWFSMYATSLRRKLPAIVVDVAEDLRNREDLSLDYLVKNTKILMGAVAHEIRNICGAVLAVYRNLSRLPKTPEQEDAPDDSDSRAGRRTTNAFRRRCRG
jgi:hypothetical protein